MVTECLEMMCFSSPLFYYLHMQCQKDALTEQFFNFFPGGSSDLF